MGSLSFARWPAVALLAGVAACAGGNEADRDGAINMTEAVAAKARVLADVRSRARGGRTPWRRPSRRRA